MSYWEFETGVFSKFIGLFTVYMEKLVFVDVQGLVLIIPIISKMIGGEGVVKSLLCRRVF